MSYYSLQPQISLELGSNEKYASFRQTNNMLTLQNSISQMRIHLVSVLAGLAAMRKEFTMLSFLLISPWEKFPVLDGIRRLKKIFQNNKHIKLTRGRPWVFSVRGQNACPLQKNSCDVQKWHLEVRKKTRSQRVPMFNSSYSRAG